MRVSHETMYRSFFGQARRALRKELTACLRTRRSQRRAHTRTEGVCEIEEERSSRAFEELDGCYTGGMQKWEYAFVDLVHTSVEDEPVQAQLFVKLPGETGKMTDDSTAADTINRLGNNGWEVVGYASPMMSVERFILKRPKE